MSTRSARHMRRKQRATYWALILVLLAGTLAVASVSRFIELGDRDDATDNAPVPPDPAPTAGFTAPSAPSALPQPARAGETFAWVTQGPGPILNGQVENVFPEDRVIGAIHTVVAHPTNPDVLWIGATNGGLWKTTNATATSPDWIPLSDDQFSLSVGALELDPTDPSHDTLLAGIGRYSSFGRVGGDRSGLLRTTDGGATWHAIDGGGFLVGKNVSGVAPRGETILVSVNAADTFSFDNIGVFRSTDGGASFEQVSLADGVSTGLPGGLAYDLAGDPTDPWTLYTGMAFAEFVEGDSGFYKSTDGGATWIKVSDSLVDSFILGGTSNIELSVGGAGQVYGGIINFGQLAALFRSGDGGQTWIPLDLPTTNEGGIVFGLQPNPKGPGPGSTPEEIGGGQGSIHFSILADPDDDHLVYLGGDRQPFGPDGFPNSIGAEDFSGRLFRVDASLAPGTQATPLTHIPGTAGSSSPHADSREMVFDARGDIVEVDDGGIFRRTAPRTNSGDWFSLAGSLEVAEFHDIAYDAVSKIIIAGSQDNGTSEQTVPGSTTWSLIAGGGDGGDVAVDDVTLADVGRSVRYSSYQFFGDFRRWVYDADNNLVSQSSPALLPLDGEAIVGQFSTPIALNEIDPTRLVIGGANAVFESLDQGETVYRIGPGIRANDLAGGDAIAYGGRRDGVGFADVIYVGSGGDVYLRIEAGVPLEMTISPFIGGFVRDLVLDPNDWMTAYVIDFNRAFKTTTGGASWVEISGNLLQLSSELRTIEFVDAPADAIFVGGRGGVFRMLVDEPGVWAEFGSGMPNAPVWDLDHDTTDDVLVAGTLGRGAWMVSNIACGTDGDGDADGTCDAEDNCLDGFNPQQQDSDVDSLGDACDNCPANANLDQLDADADTRGDACDICPTIANPDQAERAACIALVEAGGQCLDASVELVDAGDSGQLAVVQVASLPPEAIRFEILNTSCQSPDELTLTLNGVVLDTVELDPETNCSCMAVVQSVVVSDADLLAASWDTNGGNVIGVFKNGNGTALSWVRGSFEAAGVVATECLLDVEGGTCDVENLCDAGFVEGAFEEQVPTEVTLIVDIPLSETAFTNGVLPSLVAIDALPAGPGRVCVTTPAGTDCDDFVKQAEEDLAINGAACGPPTADAGEDLVAECDGDGAARVTLDGSGSTDPNSTPGTQDDIVQYEWFIDFGQSAETLLGSGRVLPATFPLGDHTTTLRVTDSFEATDRDELLVSVVDTTPPTVTCSLTALGSDDDEAGDRSFREDAAGALVVHFDATDACGEPTLSAAIELAADADDDEASGCMSLPVGDGDVFEFECDDECEIELDDELPEIEGAGASLVVVAIDAAGNEATCVVELSCVGDDDERSAVDREPRPTRRPSRVSFIPGP